MEQEHTRDRDPQQMFRLEEEEVQKSEENFRLLTEAIPQIVWTARPDGETDYYNQRWYDFTGYTRTEALQHDWWLKGLHPDDRGRSLAKWNHSVATGEPYEIEQRFWDRFQQRYHWFLDRAVPVRDSQGKVVKWFATCTDIDDRKQAEEKLLFHASLAQNILDAVIGVNLGEAIISWNSAAELLYGWKEEDVQRNIFDEVLHTQYPLTREAWLKVLQTQDRWSGEVRQQKRDGTWMDIQAGISNVRDIAGNITGRVGIFRDITQSKLIEFELHERDKQLQSAIEIARLGIWKLSLANMDIYTSNLCKLHLGFAPETSVDISMISEKIFPGEPEKLEQHAHQVLAEKGIYEAEHQVTWPDGSMHWIAASGQGQYAADGSLLAVTGVTLDITEHKLEEERKDTFIGMASHELKTPLTTVKGFTQLLKRQLHRLGMGDQITTLNKMEEQINALNRLVSELLDVTKIQAGKLEYIWTEIDLDELVKNVAEMRQQGCSQHKIKVNGAIKRVNIGDRIHLEQVLSNLITNAIKYSPQAKRVDIWKGCTKERILIKIRDYGIGIPPEEIEHIFERFYRAKTVKNKSIQGLGMGLYIAREIIEQHGGKIKVESKEGEGSTFCVELPLSFRPEPLPRS